MSTGVGSRIKEARIKLGLTQEELAKKMGKTKSLISKVENGLDNLTSDKITEYANALKVSPAFLMGWEENDFLNEQAAAYEFSKLVDIYASLGYELFHIADVYNNLNSDGQKFLLHLIDFISKEYGIESRVLTEDEIEYKFLESRGYYSSGNASQQEINKAKILQDSIEKKVLKTKSEAHSS